MKTTRLDVFLTQSGLASSRERARRLINEGKVSVDGNSKVKPSLLVSGSENIALENEKYVGRGAYKLLGAFDAFNIDVSGRICADIGASTGGFTQVLLEKGAKMVYAVDVGHGQLAEELLKDNRVINCEGINARNISKDFFEIKPEFVCCDVSFISLKSVLPAVASAAEENAELVTLIKPQFEQSKPVRNKNGIVKDKNIHVRIVEDMAEFFLSSGLALKGLAPSPISGGDGNREYLAYLKKSGVSSAQIDFKSVVNRAFEQ
ncbi:MAG: TlyA family RNA methyltransferase [Ruminococcus sp.]|nr:TlyA family RNA methyltransferase [Ruminococcus sp.]